MQNAKGVTWDLSFLYGSVEDPKINADLAKGDELSDKFVAAYRGKIANPAVDAKLLLAAIADMEAIYRHAAAPYHFASLKFSEDTQAPAHSALLAQVQQKFTIIHNKMVFFNIELMEMPDDRAEAIIADPAFAKLSWWLKEARKSKPFILSEKEEQVINIKDSNGKDALVQLYEEYTSDFDFKIELNGEEKVMTGEELSSLFVSADRETRRKAYDSFYTVYKGNVKIITSILNFLVRDHHAEGGLRKYPSAMTPAYLRDQVSEETIANLMAVVEKNYAQAQRYYRLKKKILGYDVLEGWDRSAPLGREYKLNWNEARDLVVKAYREFDAEVGDRANDFFERRWVEAEVRKGKRGGAFCSGTMPHLNPVVLMSFADTLSDTYTLAHELGHGLHDLYAAEQQGLLTYHPPLCVAETASVFGEMLLTDKLLRDASDVEMKRDVICRELEGVFNTCSRQIMYIAFEKRLHEEGSKKRLSAEELCKMWSEEEGKIYGDTVNPHPLQNYYWARIGHFVFARFYCFAYAFGKLFVLALYQLYLKDKEAFKPAYKDLLRAGGQVPPHILAEKLGMDITRPEFWQGGFDYVTHRLDELEKIVG